MLLFNAINHEHASDIARIDILGYVDEVLDDAPKSDPASNKELFLKFFPAGWQESRFHTRRNMGEIIQRLRAGQSVEEIHNEFERRRAAWHAEQEKEELSKPEPKDKLSSEWRYWKLRRMESAFRGELGDKQRRAAQREFKRIAREAITIAAFDGYHAEKMLPHFIMAMQEKGGAR